MMTGKECVSAVLARRPARIPLGFYLVDCDTIGRVLGRKTLVRDVIGQRLALAAGRRAEVVEGLKRDVVDFYRKIDCADLIVPKEAALMPARDAEPEVLRPIGEDTWEDAQHRVWKASRVENAMLCIHDPTPPRTYTPEDFPIAAEVPAPDPSVFEVIDHVVAELGAERYVCSYGLITGIPMLGGFQAGMALYADSPEVIHACQRQRVATQNALDQHYVRPGTAGIFVEHDMAGNNGPYISPAMYRRLCHPYVQERIRRLRTRREQVILHNCGNTVTLMEMFIESGISCYQSLQTNAGMEVGRLKRLFGDRLCFWGGVPLEVLIGGTPDDTRSAVRAAMQAGGPGGGFILGPSHSIAYGTKYENFMAMLDEYVAWRDRF